MIVAPVVMVQAVRIVGLTPDGHAISAAVPDGTAESHETRKRDSNDENSSKTRIVARVETNGVEFDQQQTSNGGIHTLVSSHSHGIYTWLHQETMKTQTIVHHTISVQAHEYELLTDSGDIVTRIDLATATGGENSISFFGVTATQLIEALEAARMANTPEALLESAQ